MIKPEQLDLLVLLIESLIRPNQDCSDAVTQTGLKQDILDLNDRDIASELQKRLETEESEEWWQDEDN